MADGQVLKADKDFTKDVDKALPEAESLVQHGKLQQAIDKLLVLEKQTRQASDLPSTSRLLTHIVGFCIQSQDWPMLNEQVVALSKKHGQLRQAITRMVQTVMDHIKDTPNKETGLTVIETLRTVTEGKIFVEVERARVTKLLAQIKQQSDDLTGARDTLCELQVETFGSMSRREKTEFILMQVQLCIDTGDWTQAGILSRKISTRYFNRKPKTPEQKEKEAQEKEAKAKAAKKTKETAAAGVEKNTAMDVADNEAQEVETDDTTDLKIEYYSQQITLAKHDDKYLEVCKHYRAVLDTESVENRMEQLQPTLQRTIYFIILAPYDNEQSDLLHRIAQDPRNAQHVPEDAELLTMFTKPELMRWPVVEKKFGPHLCSTDIFHPRDEKTEQDPEGKAYQRWRDLRKRVIEHNVRVVAKYYTRIQFARLTQLLDLSEDETEQYISDLVTSKTIYAKIDRPAKLVSFKKPADADDVLNEWSGNMKSLLGLLERIDHLITKEYVFAGQLIPQNYLDNSLTVGREMMARIQPAATEAKA
ncbi:MAG: hypothetical protein Q9162_003384 [Coniocarpon cinnabarinum]